MFTPMPLHSAFPAILTPTYATSVCGAGYAAFLAPWLESLALCYPDGPSALVVHDEVPEVELTALAAAYPWCRFEGRELPRGRDIRHAIPRKIHAWLEAARLAGEGPIVLLDCDAVVRRPLDHLFDGTWDVLYTWKDELFPINTGVMAGRTGAVLARVLASLLPRIESIIASPEEFARAIGSSGAVDQHAFREIIGWCNYDGVSERAVRVSGGEERLRFRGVPCRVYNETNCRAMDESLAVIHYKTGWHPILLEGAAFTQNRPASACGEMFRHWHALEAASSERAARRLVFDAARRARDRLAAVAGGYEERGILHSEMLAVCGVCDRLGVGVIIESGRARGQSTRVLSDYFAGTPTRVMSLELMRDADAAYGERALAGRGNVELLWGDAFELLPGLVREHAGERVGVLLDGPKGSPALDLAEQAFAAGASCVLIHDMRRGTPQRSDAEGRALRAFFTDDEAYVREFGSLDASCAPGPGQPITPHTWRPGMKGHDRIESYGPTLVVLLPRPGRRTEPRRVESPPWLEAAAGYAPARTP